MAEVNKTIFVPLADVSAANLSVSMIDGCGTSMFEGSVTTDPNGSPDFISHRMTSGTIPEEVVPIMWTSAIVEDLDPNDPTKTWQAAALRHGLYPVKWPD